MREVVGMGFKDFVKVAKAAVTDAITEMDGELQKNPAYVDAREATTKAAAWVRNTSADTVGKFEKTEAGKKAGEITRRVGGYVSTIPVVSAVGDATSEMAGVAGLVELRKQEPDNPWPLLWLSEALRRRQSMTRTSLLLRAPLQPISAIVSVAARAAADLDDTDPIEACERAAWGMALRILSVSKDDFDSMHIASRIYLAKGYPSQALQLAAAAALSPDSGDLALFTFAQAHYVLGNIDAAVRAANAAIDAGCSLGHALLSQVALDNKDYKEALALANMVMREDKARYFGIDPTLEAASRGTLRQQKDKASTLYLKAEKRLAGLNDVR
jgi:hypothetical protein